MEGQFPLELLKGATLQAMCRDMGYRGQIRREEMLQFLANVAEFGVEEALQKTSPLSAVKSVSAPPRTSSSGSSSSKRPIVSDYETRYKAKRVKTADTSPRKRGRPRNSSPAPEPGPSKRGRGRPRKEARKPVEKSTTTISRPRGRPRKRPISPQPDERTSSPRKKVKHTDDKSKVKRRQVFDGVLLPDRKWRTAKMKAQSPATPSLPRDEPEPEEGGEDEILPPVDNDAEESTLGSSNKENEISPDEPEVPESTDVNTPSRRVLGTAVLVQATEGGEEHGHDGDEDAEGEVDHEHENEQHSIIPPQQEAIVVTVETTTISLTDPASISNDTSSNLQTEQ